MASSMVAVPSGTASVPAGTGITQSEDVENGNVFSERNINAVTGCNEASNPGDALEEINCGTGVADDQECAICMSKLCSPRVLSCLHVFCEACLDKLLMDEAGDSKVSSVLICPLCQQETSISSKGAASLTCDYVLTNILDMSAIENMAVLCTSCKAKESAVARCSDCANFLCPHCNTAHQFMRCFESHKVVAFVLLLLLSEHQYERLMDAEPRQKEELIKLMNESKARIADCDQVSAQLGNALSELQAQHDQAKDLIVETFQSYKAEVFGKFHTESTPVTKSTPEPITTVPGVSTNQQVHTSMGCPRSISTRSPISHPTSLQSSFEGEPPFVIPPTSSPQNIPPPPPPVSLPPGPIHGLTSIQEYNLQQLASLAEKVEMVGDTNVVGPSSNPSPTSPFTLADLFAGDLSSTSHAINNLQALAKLGNTLGNQDLGNATINGGSGLVLGRGPSPAIVDTPNLSLAANSLLNGGFQSLSSSTSPILSQGADDLRGDSIPSMPVVVGNTVGNVTGSGSGNYAHPRSNNTKLTPMHIRYKFGQLGPSKGQFSSPHGFCLSADEDIIVADTNNHRIQIFDKTGIFKFQFGVPGKEEGQLWFPRKVAVMRNSGKFVVCDRGNERSRMQIFTKSGHFIKKIAIRYIDIVAGLAVTSEGYILAVDSVSPTVFVISDTGDLLRWFDCSEYMREPSDIAISGKEYFVCDFKGHCVVVFNEDGKFLRRIGCDNVTNFPNGIDISDAGDILIGDSHGNRFHVAVFSRDGSLISEFECPYVKVSRCCGLKITSEGYIVTLAKNNHHVLVLNTLYIS
ncbi:Brain tumor protein [Habropoda laboriosa]|uniref:Brain tumor protein n=1 Tax=Habropoda laboriosa TaxID=597456 RepID=A0A0L7R0Q6_9HYME|nr:Brain tumor protein [Habropoda laboriosa]